MEYAVLGWHEAGPRLHLDYRRFAYAGKFVMSSTGKAVVRDESDPTAADGTTDVDEGADVDEEPDVDGAGGVDRPTDVDLPDGVETDPTVVAAAAFNPDRTDESTLWIRYLTVRDDRRGEAIGARLAALVAVRARARGYDRCLIAVNNPFSYEALYKAGFGYTGRRTGIAELVLERPGPREPSAYVDGLETFLEEAREGDRELTEGERRFVRKRITAGRVPDVVSTPETADS